MNKEQKYSTLIYAPLGLFFHAVALLPFWVLYRISDVVYFFVYYIFRYRRNITEKNINESFPEKNDKERRKIVKDFYHQFCDTFIETIKLLHISDDEMKRRMIFHNMEAIDESVDNGRSVMVYAGHFGNWEWITSIALWSRHSSDTMQLGQVYRPLTNKWFDNLFLKLRSRFNTECYPMKTVLRDLIRVRQSGRASVTGFISDQHPARNDQDDVIMFLNHYTAFITGSEVIAKKMDMNVMMFDMKKIKRGYYECYIREITRTPKEEEQYHITNTYARMLEGYIKEQPAMWLWTHKRWKRKVTPKNPKVNE